MVFTASAVYQVTVAELTPLQLVLVGTALELTVFVFEIPTGVVADVFSRKLSIVVGFLLIGTGFSLEGSFPIFAIILLGQLVWGIGYTFTSGATQAWISDEIGETCSQPGVYAQHPGTQPDGFGRDGYRDDPGCPECEPPHPAGRYWIDYIRGIPGDEDA